MHPSVHVGSPREYRAWRARAEVFLRQAGRDPDSLDRVDATINYARNRIILFHLPEAARDTSVSETLAHEALHALLEQMGERWAARGLDDVAAPVGDRRRAGGL